MVGKLIAFTRLTQGGAKAFIALKGLRGKADPPPLPRGHKHNQYSSSLSLSIRLLELFFACNLEI
jgi:hypothetical protein